jgi:thioredoxin 2
MTDFQVKCPTCGRSNRIPAEKEGLSGRCGNCRAVLPPLYYQPRMLTERNFDDFIRSYNAPVLAEFWAPW